MSEIKSRAKRSRRSKDASSTETTPRSRAEGTLPEVSEDMVDDISQAKTPKAKSSLLQRKLAENRKIFERRSKEMTESKRAVEEKVEAIRQQMDQTDLTIVEAQKDPLAVTPVRPVLVAPQVNVYYVNARFKTLYYSIKLFILEYKYSQYATFMIYLCIFL